MPHFGLIDEYALGPVEGPLMRARLHIRSGRNRLRRGMISLGIVTLYDALTSAMQSYISDPDHIKALKMEKTDNIKNDKTIFNILTGSGVLDGTFNYEEFDKLVQEALEQELKDFDYNESLQGIESVMTQLGVMPFDENKLPPEKPESI